MRTPPYPLVPKAEENSWLDQHPHWKIAVGGFVVLLLMLLPISAGLLGVTASIRSSQPYHEAVSALYSSPQVSETLGEPLSTGFLVFGSYNGKGASGSEDFKFHVSGPKAKGTVHVCATRINNRWQTQLMDFTIDGVPQVIDLLRPNLNFAPTP